MSESKDGESAKPKGLVRRFFESLPIAEYAETAADALTDSEVLKEVPVISTLVGIWGFRNQFKRKRFLNRVEAFHSNVSELTIEELNGFDEEFESPDEAEEFVTDLIELMDRLENEQKSIMLAGVFKRLVRKELSRDNFKEISRVFERVNNIDLFLFMHGYKNPYSFEHALGDILVGVRVCKRDIKMATRQTVMLDPSKVESYISVSYEVTPFGRLVLETLHQVYEDKIDPGDLIKVGAPL
ncbi:hypothetical protein ACIP1T_02050 [Pseudomonas japonica]|uniref:hypothetical protein n=1 Tax=Pseudomonas japonica TaxID=256466 RepID=UPI00382F8862